MHLGCLCSAAQGKLGVRDAAEQEKAGIGLLFWHSACTAAQPMPYPAGPALEPRRSVTGIRGSSAL